MLVGFGSMEVFTSRTMILSRKLLGLHLILWIQPIALNSNTIHNNVQRSGEEKRRMDTAKKITTGRSTSCLEKIKIKYKKAYQIKKSLFTADCLMCLSHVSLMQNFQKRREKAGSENLHICRAHAFRCVNATSSNKRRYNNFPLSVHWCFHAVRLQVIAA